MLQTKPQAKITIMYLFTKENAKISVMYLLPSQLLLFLNGGGAAHLLQVAWPCCHYVWGFVLATDNIVWVL